MTTYTAKTPVDEAVEVTFRRTPMNPRNPQVLVYVLTAWRTDHGTVGYSLTTGLGGGAEALSNLQPKGPVFPGKAVAGWQAEVVAFAAGCLYDVERVR